MGVIYQITNTVDGKRYIGKTTKTAEQRFIAHKRKSIQPKTYLHKAMSKYGFDNFKIEVLEETEDLDNRERYHIKLLKPEYNLTDGGEGGDTSRSPNYKEGMEKRRSYAGENNPMFGRRRTGEVHQWTEESRESFKKKVACPVSCEGVVYDSVQEAQAAYPGVSIRKRLGNPRWPEFFRLREPTRRK